MESRGLEAEEYEAWLSGWEQRQAEGKESAENALVLWKGGLTRFPDRALQKNNLLVLDLRYNRLRELPQDFSCLSQLIHLDLTDNDITEIPESISRLQQLRGLFLSKNLLETLTPALGSLHSLEFLRLDHNQLIQIPYELGYLPEIRELFFQHNRITSLPPEIALLTKLETLRLEGNPLITPTATRVDDAAPCAIATAPLFTYKQDEAEADSCFKLGRNGISREAHDSLLEFLGSQLIEQDLSHSELTTFPASVLRTTSLQSLCLAYNEIETTLPDSISVLINLRLLNVSHNMIVYLPPVLTSLVSLQELNVSFNKIQNTSWPERPEEDTSFPQDFGETVQFLETFLASHNELMYLPLGLLHCPLQVLDCSFNQIQKLPRLSPFHLMGKGLRVLHVGNNKIRTIDHDVMREFGALEEFIVEGNQLLELPYMGFLAGTLRFILGGNQLSELQYMGFLAGELRLLWAGDNRLQKLSKSLGKLVELRSLRFERNDLQVIPVEIGMCTKIEDFNVLNNPRLYQPAPEICSRGPKAILAFLQRLLQARSIHTQEDESAHLTAEELNEELMSAVEVPAEDEDEGDATSPTSAGLPPTEKAPMTRAMLFAMNLREDAAGDRITLPGQAPPPNPAKAIRYLNQPCSLLRVYSDADLILCDLQHIETGKRIMRVKYDMVQ